MDDELAGELPRAIFADAINFPRLAHQSAMGDQSARIGDLLLQLLLLAFQRFDSAGKIFQLGQEAANLAERLAQIVDRNGQRRSRREQTGAADACDCQQMSNGRQALAESVALIDECDRQ